jgi:hypothetical protein
MEETMNKKLWTLLLVIFIIAIPLVLKSQSEDPGQKIGDNKLIYTPKYVDGQELADLLSSMAEGIENCEVRYFESFNTIVIIAPKETLGMFNKLLVQYDKMPEKVQLKCYLLKTSTKGHLDQSVLDAIKPALDQLKQFDLKNGFELVGSSSTPLLVNRRHEEFSSLLGLETAKGTNYRLSMENIILTSQSITIGNLTLSRDAIEESPAARISNDTDLETIEPLNSDNDTDIITGSFTASFGESTVIIKGTKSNALILIFIIEKIKN